MTACLIGLGSNVGDRPGHLHAAIAALGRHADWQLTQASCFFESAAVGGPPGQRAYLNAAATLETDLTAEQLIAALLHIEQQLGRERAEKWGPRTIDLDLLLHGQTVYESKLVTVPHPRFAERRFALAPAAEIAGSWRHPTQAKTICELLADLGPPQPGELGIRVVHSPEHMRRLVDELRRGGRRVGLVPTMGALHAGHLSLVRAALRQADEVVATIFVNPTQFAPHEDFTRYPRTLDADIEALSREGCGICFVPAADAIYPPGFSTFVDPPAVAQPLEGVCRPGHFRGVATVVLKLFHLAPADVACFGEKDFQQLQVIRQMVRDLDVPIEIVPCATVREADGLAMSSRNRYLSPAQRQQALALSGALELAAELAGAGLRDVSQITAAMRKRMEDAGITHIDYVTIADPETLLEKSWLDGPARALIAAHVGTTRLIDNRPIEPA